MTSHKKLGVGPRCADWLKAMYPENRGKAVARDFRVSENTAWRWMSGYAPTVSHLEDMVARWGRPFIEHVFDGPPQARVAIERVVAVSEELKRREHEALEKQRQAERARPTVRSDEQYSRATNTDPARPIDFDRPDWATKAPTRDLQGALKDLLTAITSRAPEPTALQRTGSFARWFLRRP